MRIPFDNVALSAVRTELAAYLGAVVQDVRQPDPNTVAIQIYQRNEGQKGAEALLLLSAHPHFARVHFCTRRPPNQPTPPVFCATLRSRLIGTQLSEVRQVAADRILLLGFQSADGSHQLIAELMGKHSNLILVDSDRRVVAAAKWVPPAKSSRPILPDREYGWPPVIDPELLTSTSPETESQWLELWKGRPERFSPFFQKLAAGRENGADRWGAWLSPTGGAYPVNPAPLVSDAVSRTSFSIALEQFYAGAEADLQREALRSSLTGQIDRARLSRSHALQGIRTTLEEGLQAARWQELGQLILTYGALSAQNVHEMHVWDLHGNPLTIPVSPTLTYPENASAYFERAKRAKSRAAHLQETAARLTADLEELSGFQALVENARLYTRLQELSELARRRRWLAQQELPAAKHERPYEGHRIRETVGPGGIRILYGENAESNDYLTLRVAKPNDYWVHVRGDTSAHVVLLTGNAPEKVQKEQLMFAARVAVQNSGSKHAGFVAVDYTLKKYVRKPRGAAKGAAVYTNEKTLHVES